MPCLFSRPPTFGIPQVSTTGIADLSHSTKSRDVVPDQSFPTRVWKCFNQQRETLQRRPLQAKPTTPTTPTTPLVPDQLGDIQHAEWSTTGDRTAFVREIDLIHDSGVDIFNAALD